MLKSSQFLEIYDEIYYYFHNQFNEIINHANTIEIIKNIKKLNIIENYLICIILSIITLILYCLLRRKTRIEKSDKLPNNDSKSNVSNNILSKLAKTIQKPSRLIRQNFDEDDDGHLSDSALSFFSRFAIQSGPRFRKRDKLFFYGKKMLRTVSHVIFSYSKFKYYKFNMN
jgi:hypothetical protein